MANIPLARRTRQATHSPHGLPGGGYTDLNRSFAMSFDFHLSPVGIAAIGALVMQIATFALVLS